MQSLYKAARIAKKEPTTPTIEPALAATPPVKVAGETVAVEAPEPDPLVLVAVAFAVPLL